MEVTGEHAGEHHTFPPFDPATFGSQLFWLVILFGLLYILMSRVALPRVGAILEERDNRIAGDLAEAARLKEATDAGDRGLRAGARGGAAERARDRAEGARRGERRRSPPTVPASRRS